MAQNYKVVGVRWFGSYKAGSVLPEWVVARAGSVQEHVERGIVEPTNDPVNVELRVPEPKAPVPEAPPELVGESNRLRDEVARLSRDLADAGILITSLRDQLAARDKSLGKQTADIEHLLTAANDHQKRADALEKELAAMRAGPVASGKDQKKTKTAEAA